MARISVCIPTHNRADVLADRLRRMAAMQDRLEIEIALSDNASTDHTRDVAAQFTREFAGFHYIRQPQLLNITLNFYAALRLATADFIAQIGDDDTILAPGILNAISRMEASPTLQAVAGNSEVYDYEKEESLGMIHFVQQEESFTLAEADKLFSKYYFLEYMVLRRDTMHRHYHNEGLSYPTGWRLMFACLRHGTIDFIPQALVLKGESRNQYGYRNYVPEIQDYPRADPEYFAAQAMPHFWKERREEVQKTALMRSVRYSADSTINANKHRKFLTAWHHAQKASLYEYDMSGYPKITFDTLVFSRLAEWIATQVAAAPAVRRLVVESFAGAGPLMEKLSERLPEHEILLAPKTHLSPVADQWIVTLAHDPALADKAFSLPGAPYCAVEDLLASCCDTPKNRPQAAELLQHGMQRVAEPAA